MWSSKRGRFDPDEGRVMGQKCEGCGAVGEAINHNFHEAQFQSDDRTAEEPRPHRADLCEACDLYGNCQGAFFDPFVMASGIDLLTGVATPWVRSGDTMVAAVRIPDLGLLAVAMLPHVAVEQSQAAGWSAAAASGAGGAGSCAGGSGKGHGEAGRGGGKGRGKGGGKGDGKGRGKARGKGRGKGGQ